MSELGAVKILRDVSKQVGDLFFSFYCQRFPPLGAEFSNKGPPATMLMMNQVKLVSPNSSIWQPEDSCQPRAVQCVRGRFAHVHILVNLVQKPLNPLQNKPLSGSGKIRWIPGTLQIKNSGAIKWSKIHLVDTNVF